MSENNDNSMRIIESHLEISARNHKKGPVTTSHWHDYFEFEIVTGGRYLNTISGKTYEAKRGCAWIMTYLDYHSVDCSEDSSLINISFTSDAVRREISDILESTPGGFICEFDDDKAQFIISLCEAAKSEYENKPLLWEETLSGLVENILIRTIRKSGENLLTSGDKTPHLLQSVISYINKNFKSDVSIATSSKKFAISPGRLGLIFSKNFGMSYNEYVNKVRLRHACNLLSGTDLTAKQIAFDCGYSSVEYFFYVFRKELKTTPIEFRNRH
ncbi:MAG: helix-turn-helix transcriptional regulator [Clostridia bacterium]|nr:helix-turn-helix transcriptional regulator [Clostridia bacterium]